MRVRIETQPLSGAPSTRDLDVAAIAIGGSPHNTIVLPGNRVGTMHLLLNCGADGIWRAQAQGPYRFGLDGQSGLQDAVLQPGQTLALGPHRIQVLAPTDGLSLVLSVALDAEANARRGALDLAGAGLRMRRPAWVAAIALLLLTLLIPLVMALLPAETPVRAFLPTDTLWNSGTISNAHQHLANDCRSCHVDLFVQVRDETCRSCHQGLGEHSADTDILHASGLSERGCANCHKEHGGTHAVMPEHSGLCTDCHAAPHQEDWSAHLSPAADFERAHPPIRVNVISGWDGDIPTFERTPLADAPADNSGLIYPHDLHLEADLDGPDGPETLACVDCHQPGPGRVGFEPIAFEPHCQRCHALDVEAPDATVTLPHGDIVAARWMLERIATDALADMPDPNTPDIERRRAGSQADRGDGPTTEGWVQSQIESRLCAKCHVVSAEGEGVAPVLLAQSWWPHARFTHAPHQTTECALCHSAETSKDAAELLLPPIATCRQCHAGVAYSAGIQSACVDCHGFHQVSATHGVGDREGRLDGEASIQPVEMGLQP